MQGTIAHKGVRVLEQGWNFWASCSSFPELDTHVLSTRGSPEQTNPEVIAALEVYTGVPKPRVNPLDTGTCWNWSPQQRALNALILHFWQFQGTAITAVEQHRKIRFIHKILLMSKSQYENKGMAWHSLTPRDWKRYGTIFLYLSHHTYSGKNTGKHPR